MNKQFIAILAALLMTACVGGSMLAIGGVALFNPNGTTAANSQAQAAQVVDTNTSQQSQIQQMQGLIAQYQAREQQYQARESQYQQQLDQANTQIQQAQQEMQQIQALLNALQQRGLITVTSDGRIYINQ
jgi:peptidoglycan hydrolase CwlO-like protein